MNQLEVGKGGLPRLNVGEKNVSGAQERGQATLPNPELIYFSKDLKR